MNAMESQYSRLDRLLHNSAMSMLDLQRVLSAIEDRSFARQIDTIGAQRPVFITSLPRAGTTLLLEIICSDPRFVSHTYRDMPFLLCPMFWDRFSRRFHKEAVARERAHGDGLTVDFDSVEAFEEVIWRAFWPNQFGEDRIRPWRVDQQNQDGDFVSFLRQHMRKLIALQRSRRASEAPKRYVSKNNANIARLGYLQQHFPDGTILVPFRTPMAHVCSLIRQHRNFLEAHHRNDFVRRYMESIGHLEFGATLRPIDFGGWLDKALDLDPLSPNFWCEYWIFAYDSVLSNQSDSVFLFSYDRLCEFPSEGLQKLCECLGLTDRAHIFASAHRFRPPTSYDEEVLHIRPDLAKRSQEVHRQLLERSQI